MVNARKGKITSASGDIAAYVDTNCAVKLNGQTYTETIRSSRCHLLIRGMKCSECVSYRDTLRSIHHRWSKKQNKSPSEFTSTHTHTNERWLNTPQRKKKVPRLKSRVRASEKRAKYMAEKIKESVDKKGMQVDDQMHVGLNHILNDHTKEIEKKYEEGSFHRLLGSTNDKFVEVSDPASLAPNAYSLVLASKNEVQFSIRCTEGYSNLTLWSNSSRLHPLH